MNQLLLDIFELVVNGAEDVPRLNEAILQLAVQGKLTSSATHLRGESATHLGGASHLDEPASELLKRIAAEKKRLGIKSQPLPEIVEEERPYDLPEGWEWVRLPQIGQINPRNYAEDGLEASFVPMTLISESFGETHKSETRNWEEIRKGYTHFQENDVAVAKITPCFQNGKSAIMQNLVNGIGAGTTEIYVFRRFTEDILPEYVYAFFNTPKFRQDGQEKMKGTAGQQRVPKDYILTVPFPLPPLAEQKRIVERVDALLAQTRQLETRLAEAEVGLVTLHSAAIQELLTASDADDFAAKWQFIADNFDTLYDEAYPEAALANVAELKQAILQLAVQGKLTSSATHLGGASHLDEPASELLKRIAAEKKRLGIKSQPLPEIGEEERPYDLPDGWEWARLDDLTNVGTGATPLRTDPKYWKNGSVPWVTSSATNNLFVSQASEYVTELALKETNLTLYPKGTLLIAMYGQGKTRGQVTELLIETTTNQACAAVVFYETSKEIKDYLKLFFQKNYDEIRLLAEGGAQPNLNLGKIKNTVIPLPPLAEQKRIVTRVNALLQLCDDLAAHIREAQATRTALRDAVLGS